MIPISPIFVGMVLVRQFRAVLNDIPTIDP